jgi:hypothetical protein
MQRHALTTRVERAPLKPLADNNDKTRKKFNSPPSIMIDKKGKTTFTLGKLLGEVSLFFKEIGWVCEMLSSK